MTSYEYCFDLIQSLRASSDLNLREVKWLTDARVIGVARDAEGRVEMFLCGPELHPDSKDVRDSMEFRVVHREDSQQFEANRLLLPAFGHFDQVAAFICTELIRAGIDQSLAQAFAQTEPIIELAIERMRLSDQAIIGLAGELLMLEALSRHARDDQVGEIISRWDGWRRSSRDLRVGGVGIEVKTTTGPTSSHFVEGVHQVERNDGSDRLTRETRLFLVSIGLQTASSDGNIFTIPLLVDRIIARMTTAQVSTIETQRFLAHIAEYGTADGRGYEHGSNSTDLAYSVAFQTSFFRAYDMDDPAVQVLRRRELATLSHVDGRSVRYRMELPSLLSASNPLTGANQVAKEILRDGR